MILFSYLSKFPQNKKEFSDKLGIAESTLYKYINQERVPVLEVAIKIHTLTKGLVGYKDMLVDAQDTETTEKDEDIL